MLETVKLLVESSMWQNLIYYKRANDTDTSWTKLVVIN